jgi:hypothetical protein
MRPYRHFPNVILVLGIICFAAVSIMAFSGSTLNLWVRQEAKGAPRLPKIISNVKKLEVVSAAIEGQDDASAVAVIEVRNNSDKAIIAVAVESGDDKDSSGVSLNGFKNSDEQPAIVLKPHGSLKVRFSLSDVRAGCPIRIAGVMYADGTEEGEESALGTLHRHKEHEQKSKREEPPSRQ